MNIISLIENGNISHLFLFGLALSLGALHGLEPGHSKTMMAAYIIAIKGKVRDAIILGLCPSLVHKLETRVSYMPTIEPSGPDIR